MRAHAKQAGPGLDRGRPFPVPVEAAGPAGPRLVIEEVSTRLGNEAAEVIVQLALGSLRFTGAAVSPAGDRQIWELAAAASVAAIQQYLQHNVVDPPTPQVQLLDVAALATSTGQDYIAATVRLTHASKQTDLLGSALVRNDRSRTAVAAALDATSRYLGRLCSTTAASAEQVWHQAAHPMSVTSSDVGAHIREPLCDKEMQGSPDTEFASFHQQHIEATHSAGFPAIGVLISPAVIQASAVDSRGGTIADARRPGGAGEPAEATLSLAMEAVREVLDRMDGAGEVTSIGLAVPGRLLLREGVCVASAEFPNWRHVPLNSPFANEFGLPVTAITPTPAAAFAELSFGAARGISDLLHLRIGAQIDLALVMGGRPMLAHLSPGQAGHMVIEPDGPRCACGDLGCWQTLAARDALLARVARAVRAGAPSAVAASVDSQPGAITPALVVRMAAAGDAVARRAIEETGRYLALGLANLIALLGPQAVTVEGHPPVLGAALLRAAEASLKSSPRASLLSHCVLLSADMGESASALGAAAWAARGGAW